PQQSALSYPAPAASPQAGAAAPNGAQPGPTPATTPSSDFESWWRKCVHDGFVPNTALPIKTVTANTAASSQQNAVTPAASPAGSQFELVFRTDPTIYDGRFANNGWLQELPKPLSKVTWDNAALVSP